MRKPVKIGTRDSQLAVWQASVVKDLLKEQDINSELVFINTDGDSDLITPLYEIGVQGIFTKSLDLALLNNRIDLAVHSMKDVPTQPAQGIRQAAVLKRGSFKDILVYKYQDNFMNDRKSNAVIATSSIRRAAQWLHRYPLHKINNLRGNVNTRLKKIEENDWSGGIFAAAGVERLGLRPENSVELDWMLPAPAQGAIMVVCREGENALFDSCNVFNDPITASCTKIERDFLRTLAGGCSTPISALAESMYGKIIFRGNVCSPDGQKLSEVEIVFDGASPDAGSRAAQELLSKEGVQEILDKMHEKQD